MLFFLYLSMLYCSFIILLTQCKIVQQTPFSCGSNLTNFLAESYSILSPSVLVDTMVTNETMEVLENDKESLDNEECKIKGDGDLFSGTKIVISILNTFF